MFQILEMLIILSNTIKINNYLIFTIKASDEKILFITISAYWKFNPTN